MAADLVRTPVSGIHVQACGDCHLLNFGGFATPERRLILDINDFDETLPSPWEWDVKRLVASFVLAARSNGLSDDDGRDAAIACACSYRRKIRDFAAMDMLDVWYTRLEDSDVLAMLLVVIEVAADSAQPRPAPDDFIAIAAHELRNPMTPIVGVAELREHTRGLAEAEVAAPSEEVWPQVFDQLQQAAPPNQ